MTDLVAFTGAGISKASGVPTFQEMGDVRDKLSRDFYRNNPEEFYELLLKMKRIISRANPNPAHISLSDYKIPIVTMNIDGLHTRAGTASIVEIHGNLEHVYCPSCNREEDYCFLENSIYCDECNVILEPNVVLYGDMMPRFHEAENIVKTAKELLVIGTSFYTSTSTFMVNIAKRSGARIKIINEDAEHQVPEYLKSYFTR